MSSRPETLRGFNNAGDGHWPPWLGEIRITPSSNRAKAGGSVYIYAGTVQPIRPSFSKIMLWRCSRASNWKDMASLLTLIGILGFSRVLADDTVQNNAAVTCKDIEHKISQASDVIYPSKSENQTLRGDTAQVPG